MNKSIFCGIFGHQFNERKETKEQHEGQWYLMEIRRKCEVCELWEIDNTGRLGMANRKYNMNIKQGHLIPVKNPTQRRMRNEGQYKSGYSRYSPIPIQYQSAGLSYCHYLYNMYNICIQLYAKGFK